MSETKLYIPVKSFLEERGFDVKGEVEDCDLVARRAEEIVVVELKRRPNLTLVLQGIDRKKITDSVYLAVEAPTHRRRRRWNEFCRLCRLLGLGLIAVHVNRHPAFVEVTSEPGPYTPKKNGRRRRSLLKEFEKRSGDFNVGGSTGRPVVTAYRENALRIAAFLADRNENVPLAEIRNATGLPKAGSILQKNYYGWFARVSRGVYTLTPVGEKALETYRDVVDLLRHSQSP